MILVQHSAPASAAGKMLQAADNARKQGVPECRRTIIGQ
jgi:hypothetical protein